MRRDPDVLVAGAGIAGLFCAYHLRLAGRSVVVADRGPVSAPGASSYGNTGFVGTQGATPFAGPFDAIGGADEELRTWLSLFDRARHDGRGQARCEALLGLKRRSLETLRTLCAADRLAPHFTPAGVVLVFKTSQACEKVSRGAVPMRILSPAELRALEPGVAFDVHGALFNEDAGFVHSPGFVREFAAMLRDMGVEIWEHAEVVGFEAVGRDVTEVRTARGTVCPHETVIAAGAWSARCAGMLGVDLALQPVKGYSVTVKTPQHAPRSAMLLSEGHVAIAPLGDRLRFAGYMELSGWDTSVSPRGVEHILETVRSYLPGLESTPIVEVWAGLRPSTPDSLPFLGRVPAYRNVSFACGYGHIGMGIAPAGGELIAQLLAGDRTGMNLTPFAIDRFGKE